MPLSNGDEDDMASTSASSVAERYPGLEVLSTDPDNAQTASRSHLEDYLTPREQHYIRNHHRTPNIDEGEWTVSLTGLVESAVDLSMDELKHDYPTDSVMHMMECSGNGRAYFSPDAEGDQWTVGAVGNAIWTGTPIRAILDDHGAATDDGLWLTAVGGEAKEDEDVFARSIPMEKALEDCLLAYEMNGRPMSAEHGFPVRLLVPGWFGNNSVKWVERLHVMDEMVNGEAWESRDGQDYTEYQQSSYRLLPAQDSEPKRYADIETFDTQDQMQAEEEIRNAYFFDQLVKSLFTSPQDGEELIPASDSCIELTGVAWSGDDAVERVEVSTDGGETWDEADFVGPDLGRYTVRKFRYVWEAEAGEHTLLSRATDERGRTQPATISDPDSGRRGIENDEYPWNQKGYGNNAYEPLGITVTVRD
ncbi:sulfite oxidase [Haloarcula amylovorans]|uniref:sulfite oxidase n=1 Tax=Haloarcula amylovorans TaxID=2562280 RepID=UPI001FD79E7F|nr:sulfite oxidase [Halomicroarcula amylolytica]